MRPKEPNFCGSMYHQFKNIGMYYYEIANRRVGTLIVNPRAVIRQVTIFNDKFGKQNKMIGIIFILCKSCFRV